MKHGRGSLSDAESAEREIECEGSEEYFQSFRQSLGSIICQERTKSSHQICGFGRAGREDASSHIGHKKAGCEIENDLNQQNRAKILDTKDRENHGKERWVSR